MNMKTIEGLKVERLSYTLAEILIAAAIIWGVPLLILAIAAGGR